MVVVLQGLLESFKGNLVHTPPQAYHIIHFVNGTECDITGQPRSARVEVIFLLMLCMNEDEAAASTFGSMPGLCFLRFPQYNRDRSNTFVAKSVGYS